MKIATLALATCFLVSSAMLAVGCGGDPEPVSCTSTSGGLKSCATYGPADGSDVGQDDLDQACASLENSKTVDSCPKEDAVGSCTLTLNGITSTLVLYGGTDALDGALCKASGDGAVWKPAGE